MAYRKDGKMDRRTSEYKEAVARMAKARKAMGESRGGAGTAAGASPKPTAAGRRADGRLDQRTVEGREMAAKMAAMRAARSKGKSKGFFTWLFGK